MTDDLYDRWLQVVKLILQGILLIPPDECPDFIYKMMAATWKTDPKDRTNFPDILDAFIASSCTCRLRLTSHSGRRGQSSRRTSPELPSLYEVDEGVDDELGAGAKACCSGGDQADADQKVAQDAEHSPACHSGQQAEDPYMVPLQAVVTKSPE